MGGSNGQKLSFILAEASHAFWRSRRDHVEFRLQIQQNTNLNVISEMCLHEVGNFANFSRFV